jgi:hypothetical protein
MTSPHLILLDCHWWEVVCKLKEGLENVIKAGFEVLFGAFYTAITFVVTEAVKLILKTVGTIWLKVETPGIEGGGRSGPTIDFMQGRVMWLALLVATASVVIAGIKMAWTMRGDEMMPMLKSLLTFMIATVFGIVLVNILVQIGNDFSDWVVRDPGGGKTFEERIDAAMDADIPGKLIFVLTVGVGAIVTSIIQIGLMIVRNGMLVVLVGVLPLAAAATNTEMGQAWFRKLVGWLVAFIAYKPVAALIFAASLRMMGDGSDAGWKSATTGVAMMVMSVIALPALIKFVTPRAGG